MSSSATGVSANGDGAISDAGTNAPARVGMRALFSAHMTLGKVRLSALVVFTTALGFVVASKLSPDPSKGFDYWRLMWTCAGTFLAAVGAAAFNQALETRRDARMNRTRKRPLVTRVLSRNYAATFGLIVSIIGVAILCPTSNGLAAVLATVTVLIYAVIYTPLKPRSTLNTLVGAVVGGIPPMIGWAAAADSLTPGAWLLGAILFVWQIPHFLALAWLYREDYARGGFRMLPAVDPTGVLTSRMAFVYSAGLIPLSLLLIKLGHAGALFAAVAIPLGVGLTVFALRFAMTRTNAAARQLFLASIVYLPLFSIVLMINAQRPANTPTIQTSPSAVISVPVGDERP